MIAIVDPIGTDRRSCATAFLGGDGIFVAAVGLCDEQESWDTRGPR